MTQTRDQKLQKKREYRSKNKEKISAQRKAYTKRYYAQNSEWLKAKQIAYNKKNSELPGEEGVQFRARRMEISRQSRIGITASEFNEMLDSQGGVCAICGTDSPPGSGWHLDHDHFYAHNEIAGHRGILCHHCNLMLGNARDNIDLLESAKKYLVRWMKR